MTKHIKTTTTTNQEDKYEKLFQAEKDEFPDAKFSISCFKTIAEIQTKKLCKDNVIIYADEYGTEKNQIDFYVIKKPEGQTHILYKDIIHQLIDAGLSREGYDHRYLEKFGLNSHSKGMDFQTKNKKSIKTYGAFFGS
jgi:hypothetical protein